MKSSSISPSKKEEEQIPGATSSATESDDMMDDLEPLALHRSHSVPISGPKSSLSKGNDSPVVRSLARDKGKRGEETSFANLDEDEQLLAVFRLAVWICRRPASVLSKADKAALLVHAINNMNSLMKTTKSVSSLA